MGRSPWWSYWDVTMFSYKELRWGTWKKVRCFKILQTVLWYRLWQKPAHEELHFSASLEMRHVYVI